jgi:glutamyl endopeptidase
MHIEYLRPPHGASFIFGSDQRTRASNTNLFPNAAIGLVQANYGNEILEGTGALIGNRTVLTAAHVVYDPSLGGWPDSITFIPGLNGSYVPFGLATVISHEVPAAWIDSGQEDADIAVLGLSTAVGLQTGYFQIAEPASSFFTGLAMHSAGYPSDLINNVQYDAPGTSQGLDGAFLLEDIDTEPGQSGSPIWYGDATTGEPMLVAVLKGTRQLTDNLGRTTVQGIGVVITPSFATLINDALLANGDTAQNVSMTPASSATPAPSQCGACGAGLGQATLACTLGWGTCWLSRRRRSL